MKLQHLETILADLRTHLAKLDECVRALAQELETAKADRDVFVTVLYAGRKNYKWASAHANKSGHRIERAVRSSYNQAMAAGYMGSIREWEALLRVFKAQENRGVFGEHTEEDGF